MVKIINNKAKLILITSYKLGYLLCKLIQFKYSNKYNNSNYKWNKYIIEVDAFNYLIKYKKYLIIRNPYTRIISGFFAISKNKKYNEFNKLYNTFEDFINILYKEHKNKKYFILKNEHIKPFSLQNGYIINEKDIKIYETTELNNFIDEMNNIYKLDIPKKKIHNFKYSNQIIKNAHKLSISDAFLIKPNKKSFLQNNKINLKIKEIFKVDFDFSEKIGYNFTINNYID